MACARYGYERDLLDLLTQLARDMDRKIQRQKERAEQDNRPRALNADDREKLDAIKARTRAAHACAGVAKEVVTLEKSEVWRKRATWTAASRLRHRRRRFAQQQAELLCKTFVPPRPYPYPTSLCACRLRRWWR